ncbi:hypothetical protein SEPCBS57363_006785 [Sporothrix epigloea]|uniref:Uncharacterized protein n=1 Tax=Sporothrix epigloea TaxID=1892477 RepID=A0ABP0E636_9PEZI
MEISGPSATDMLVIMPPSIQQEARDLLENFDEISATGDCGKRICKAFLKAIYEHDASQTRFSAAWRHLKETVAEAKSFDFDKEGIAATIKYTFESRGKYATQLKYLTSILDELLKEQEKIEAILLLLKGVAFVAPPTQAYNYFTRQRTVYAAMKRQFGYYRAGMNSCRAFEIPGEKFGLVPFEDIILSEDGQTMIWNEEIADWDLLEDIHPCKYVPGSDWGKYFYDLTPGEFFMKNGRAQVEYSHASPAKRLLESLQTTHFLATSGSASRSEAKENMEQKIQTRTQLHDVSVLINEPFVLPPAKVPHLYELSRKVEEVSTGVLPVVKDTQEQETVIYRITQ